ncbi:hypothetical protein D3C76_908790 [compost metagenome]
MLKSIILVLNVIVYVLFIVPLKVYFNILVDAILLSLLKDPAVLSSIVAEPAT